MTSFRSIRWASDPDHIASRFQEYQRLMKHWSAVLPIELLNVNYEDTVADVESTASVAQVRQPIYGCSVGRWRNYESALGKLFVRRSGHSEGDVLF